MFWIEEIKIWGHDSSVLYHSIVCQFLPTTCPLKKTKKTKYILWWRLTYCFVLPPFRNLSKPIAVQSKEKEDRYVDNFRVKTCPVFITSFFFFMIKVLFGGEKKKCFVSFCSPRVVFGRGVQERHPGGWPHASRSALPLRLSLFQQRHRSALLGPNAAFYQDVSRLPGWVTAFSLVAKDFRLLQHMELKLAP